MFVLASASPRRLELLRSVGIEPIVHVADVPEIEDPSVAPAENAARFALAKARAGSARYPEKAVLGADTIVTIDGKLLGKPLDRDDAKRMLESLSGRGHYVVTCVALVPPEGAAWPLTTLRVFTGVVFRALSAGEIEGYLATDEWRDKAGAYAIQGRAACFASSVLGSYTNVVGLPLAEVVEELLTVGVLAEGWGPR